MKRKLIILAMLITMIFTVASCEYASVKKANDVEKPVSMFVEIENSGNWTIVYHRETKVMYAVSIGSYNSGNFTLLVNADGTPMVYGGQK